MIYLSKLPKEIPQGQVLVHNHVRPVKQIGLNGFRCWLQKIDPTLVKCDCGWAPKFAEHFKVRIEQIWMSKWN
jgi:hypothetical protein